MAEQQKPAELSGAARSQMIHALNQYREKSVSERLDEKHNAATVWDGSQENWEFITIPEENALGEKHATMGLNDKEFKAGQTYKVPPAVAEHIRERLSVYGKSQRRILQPRPDTDALRDQRKGGTMGGEFILGNN